MPVNIAVVDDHSLFRKGLINLIHSIDSEFEVVLEAANGKDLLDVLNPKELPDLIILDLDMPIMDGHATTLKLKGLYPDLGIIMLTMKDDEQSLIKMLKAGVNGYLNKDVEPDDLKAAIHEVYQKGFHYTEQVSGTLINILRQPEEANRVKLSDQEMKFLGFACSELTYKEIADRMHLSEKTIDGYRAKLFEKLQVKSRVGLALYAVKNKLISI